MINVSKPYGAKDNEVNTEMRAILERYLKKEGLVVSEIEIYGASVIAYTDTGRKFQMSKAEGCKVGTSYNQRNYFYMTETIAGKRVRIKKERW